MRGRRGRRAAAAARRGRERRASLTVALTPHASKLMTKNTGIVGESGENAPRDVILVQAMLQAIENAEGKPYYNSRYDGVFGPVTRAAIAAVQSARVVR